LKQVFGPAAAARTNGPWVDPKSRADGRDGMKVTILALYNTTGTSVMGPMDVFFHTGKLWNHIHGLKPTPYFDVEIAGIDGNPVKCINNVMIQPHCSINDVRQTDLIMVACIANFAKTIQHGAEALEWLRYHYAQGAEIASVCTGSFFLAATGLLDGKAATTHWGFVDEFKRMFPKVNLKPERLITDEDRLYCSGALYSGVDLSIYLVEKYCGHSVAVQCAKTLVHDMNRESQTPYATFRFQRKHQDEKIRTAQQWIETNYMEEFEVDQLAKHCGMSRRTFERRFKHATGDTPLAYMQRVRVETAKRLLESCVMSFDEICYQVGYENSNFFREVFKKHTRLLPSEYQKQFQRYNSTMN
jgi:transcriptional regulator GlxA family with amidase domain